MVGRHFDVLLGQHSAESAICCLCVRYVCSRVGFIIGLGGPCCRFHGSSYLSRAVSIVLEDGSEKFLFLAHHVKNSFQFVQILESLRVQPEDLIVSFEVVSLFTIVPIVDSLELLIHHFEANILALFKHALTSTYFCFDGQFYEQTDERAMGSPLFPVITNFLKEDFEKKATEQAIHKPVC